MNETIATQTFLAERAAIQSRPEAVPTSGGNKSKPVLSDGHRSLLRRLIQQQRWSPAEFAPLASMAARMPYAAMDAINAWSLARFGLCALSLTRDGTISVNEIIKPLIEPWKRILESTIRSSLLQNAKSPHQVKPFALQS